MTLNQLITQLTQVSRRLSSGDIPITVNNQQAEITDITLEGDDGVYWCNINIKEAEK